MSFWQFSFRGTNQIKNKFQVFRVEFNGKLVISQVIWKLLPKWRWLCVCVFLLKIR